ncbi:UNVERIFIED_CONTAM: hypothetical protein FKN15_033301 [Acipenser sinensis]
MVTLKELERSTAEMGETVHGTAITRTLHKAGFYGRVARRKPLQKKNPYQILFGFCQKACGRHSKHVEKGSLV